MPLEIPGYYYDEVKKKYFKIEKSHTAPPAASWSSDSVKRRKAQHEVAQAELQRTHLTRNHIKRHRLRKDVVASSLLARESEYRRVAEPGWGRPEDEDVGAAAWARGVVDKAYFPFVPSFVRSGYAHLPYFYMGGENFETDVGIAYASMDEMTLVAAYINTDDNENIQDFQRDIGKTYRTEMRHFPRISSINYHQSSNRVLCTSTEDDSTCSLYFFSPPRTNCPYDRRDQLLGGITTYPQLSIQHRLNKQCIIHRSTPAPASSDLLCVIGTSEGILRVQSNEIMAFTSDSPPRSGGFSARNDRKNHTPREIFDQDFQKSDRNVLLAGGRQPRLWITDLRTPDLEWRYVPQASSIAHLRSVSPHQVLVAGLRNTMSLYDMRFFGRRPNGAKPLLEFPEYRNEAHFQTGWDVCPELGVVAAAQDNGTVKLFSLKSGRMLASPAALDRIKTDVPIKAMMFQTLTGERLPSLFVADGPSLRKFSFGTEVAGEDE